MTTDEMIAVIRALENGDPVEVFMGKWKEVIAGQYHRPDFSRFTYRIKPAAPRDFYLDRWTRRFLEADDPFVKNHAGCLVHVREVIE